jgi:hypothetical protein
MPSEQLLLSLEAHTQTITTGFLQDTVEGKENRSVLLLEAHKIRIQLDKLIVLERLGKTKQAATLTDKLETALGLLELHMEQTL